MKARPIIAATLAVTLATGAALFSSWALAHDGAARQETVTPLQQQALPDVTGKQVVMAVVSYEPGQASLPHVHSGSVFAYVLEGEIVSQLDGQAPVTYKAGQSWYETPRVGHLVSKNASNTKPAKLLAWLIVDQGAPLKEPLKK